MTIEHARIALLASGAAMLCVATCVLAVNPRRSLHRAFAALLAVRGLTILLPQASEDPAWVLAAANMQPAFALAVVPLALYCCTLDLRPHAPARPLGWWTLAAIGILEALYWADHSLFQTLSATGAGGALQAAHGLQYAAFGPLAALASLAGVMLAIAGLRFAVQYRAQARGPQAKPLLLLAAAFLVGGLFDGANRLVALMDLLDSPAGFPWLPWGWAVMGLPACAVVPAALGTVVLASGAARPHRRAELWILGLGAVAVGAGLLRLALPPNPDPAGNAAHLVLAGVARLLMPTLLASGLLADAVARAGTKVQKAFAWSVVAVTLALTATGAAAFADGRIETPGPVAATIGAAVAATLAIPLLHAGRAFARWAVPGGPDRVPAAQGAQAAASLSPTNSTVRFTRH